MYIYISSLLKEAYLYWYFFAEKTVLAVFLIISTYSLINDDNKKINRFQIYSADPT